MEVFEDSVLDEEWSKYLESLNSEKKNKSSGKSKHKKGNKSRKKNKDAASKDYTTFNDLKKHVRALSRARIELEMESDMVDCLDDEEDNDESLSREDDSISNSIENDRLTHMHQSVLETYWNETSDDANESTEVDISSRDSSSDSNDYDNHEDDGGVLDATLVDAHKETLLRRKPSISSVHMKSSNRRPKNASMKSLTPMISPQNSNKSTKSNDSNKSSRSIRISHENQSKDTDNEATEDIDDADDGHVRGESDGYGYDQELESLKEQLMSVRRTQSKRHLRSKSKEELLLSVLDIDKTQLNSKDLKNYTEKAVHAYQKMHKIEKNRVVRQKSVRNLMRSNVMNTKRKIHRRCVSSSRVTGPKTHLSIYNSMDKGSIHRLKKRKRKLADPYMEEWNDSLDPDHYVWYDNVPDGQCWDDCELSLRNRRIQFLVVMAVDNQYITISELSHKQNELLLLHQKSLRF